jgi:GT2 family glycosyltransferase
MVQVSVIIPHYDDLEALDTCLTSLAPSRVDGGVEVIVADNGSPCGIEAVRALAGDRATVVLQEEKGAGPARNAGIAAARGEILAFIDSDCIASSSWVQAGVKALDTFDIVGGEVVVGARADCEKSGPEVFELAFAFRNEGYIREKGFSVSANLFCRRNVVETIGGFSNGVSEDVEWCHRATKAGFRLGYSREASIVHPARQTWQQLKRKWHRINSETMHLRAQAGAGALSWRLRSVAVALSALPHSARILRLQGVTGRERARGLATLFAIRAWRSWDGITQRYPYSIGRAPSLETRQSH